MRVFEPDYEAVGRLAESRNLIHSITSPIAINDCANAVLALGAQPIMAEHPEEVAGITEMAKALTVSYANITDIRLESIVISCKKAREIGISSVFDAVGVTCSKLRMDSARRLIAEACPSIIKGNISEIRALAGFTDSSVGIDAGESETVKNISDGDANFRIASEIVKRFAKESGAVVLASGPVDIISDGETSVYISNGCARMSRITGTGCILTCIIGCLLSVTFPLQAAVLGTSIWGICGELADEKTDGKRLGSYHAALMDELSEMTVEKAAERAKIVIE